MRRNKFIAAVLTMAATPMLAFSKIQNSIEEMIKVLKPMPARAAFMAI
jgi:hypothetical protein